MRGPASIAINPAQDRSWFLVCLAAGPILAFTVAVLWGAQGLYHWQAPGYLLAFPLLGREIADRMSANRTVIRWWLKSSIAAFLIIVTILATHTANGWMRQVAPQWFNAGDPTVEALDWRNLEVYLRERGMISDQSGFVVSGHWIDSGKIDYALGGKRPVLCLSQEPHHFAFLHNLAEFKGKDALLIGRRHVMEDASTVFGPYFSSIEPAGSVSITRGGRPELDIVVFYARNFSGTFPLPYGISE